MSTRWVQFRKEGAGWVWNSGKISFSIIARKLVMEAGFLNGECLAETAGFLQVRRDNRLGNTWKYKER